MVTKMPATPKNVRLVAPDGDVYPVELVYQGFVDGTHEWSAVIEYGMEIGPEWSLYASVLPAHTSISVCFRLPEESASN
jgi:hypothetical protein